MRVTLHCIAALSRAGLFEDDAHQSRFGELMNCFEDYPFFNRGLCKCMYLSAMDDEHFLVMLEVLNAMALDKSRDTQFMSDQREELEEAWNTDDQIIVRLSDAWLNNRTYEVPFDRMTNAGAYIIHRGFEAAEIIDELFDKARGQS